MDTARATCALASVREFGFPSRFTSAQRRPGRLYKRCMAAGSSNWRKNRLFLSVSPETGIGILPTRRFNSACATTSTFTHSRAAWISASPRSRLKLFSRPPSSFRRRRKMRLRASGQTSSARDVMLAGLISLSTSAVTAASDLVPTQSPGLRRKRPRSGVCGKWIGPATPPAGNHPHPCRTKPAAVSSRSAWPGRERRGPSPA